jgi:hypothetical protein
MNKYNCEFCGAEPDVCAEDWNSWECGAKEEYINGTWVYTRMCPARITTAINKLQSRLSALEDATKDLQYTWQATADMELRNETRIAAIEANASVAANCATTPAQTKRQHVAERVLMAIIAHYGSPDKHENHIERVYLNVAQWLRQCARFISALGLALCKTLGIPELIIVLESVAAVLEEAAEEEEK